MPVSIDMEALAEAERDLTELIEVVLEFYEKTEVASAIIEEGGDYSESFVERMQQGKVEQDEARISISAFLRQDPAELISAGRKAFCEKMRSDYRRWTAIIDELVACRDRGFRMLS